MSTTAATQLIVGAELFGGPEITLPSDIQGNSTAHAMEFPFYDTTIVHKLTKLTLF